MTSETAVNAGWTCGFSSIIQELGRIASLEYPVFKPSEERWSNSNRVTKPAPEASISAKHEATTMPVPGLSLPRAAALRPNVPRTPPTLLRPLTASGPPLSAWTGRTPEDHAVNRTDEQDVQSQPSQQGMREKKKGDSHSHGIAEKGGEYNKKAEEDKPQAPKPVIGMNDERGGKGR